jgi:hypothetical protein
MYVHLRLQADEAEAPALDLRVEYDHQTQSLDKVLQEIGSLVERVTKFDDDEEYSSGYVPPQDVLLWSSGAVPIDLGKIKTLTFNVTADESGEESDSPW